jgi:hypothetical protein
MSNMLALVSRSAVLICWCFADSNVAGMEKLHYYVQQTSVALQYAKKLFNGEGHHFGFEYCTNTHTVLGNVTAASFSGKLHYLVMPQPQMTNIFKAYMVVQDKNFVWYIKDLKTQYMKTDVWTLMLTS